jgi:hypothetical protein
MKLQRFAVALASTGLLATTAVSGSAVAAGTATPVPSLKDNILKVKQHSAAQPAADPCANALGWVTPNGVMHPWDAIARRPQASGPEEPFKFVATRASGTWYLHFDGATNYLYYYGLFLQGGNLYRHKSTISQGTGAVTPKATKVGGGWTSFKAIATSNHTYTGPRHAYLYGLNTNGNLYRYAQVGTTVKPLGSFAGFKSFKTITVISETATYDTLLMTTTAGALYTIRIPIAVTTKPVVKLVRSTGFAAYEALTVNSCGVRGGSLVLAVDHDTDAGYQYAFSKFNGTATAMQPYGKVSAVFNGTTTVAFTGYNDQLASE